MTRRPSLPPSGPGRPELGRTPAHNRAAATALAEIPGGGAQRRGRLGRHLLAAGQPAAAAEPLLDASRAAMLEVIAGKAAPDVGHVLSL